jgi:hypothetical protein
VRGFERRHSNRGWPFYLIVDAKGAVRFGRSGLLRDLGAKVRGVMAEIAPGKPVPLVAYAGTRYLEKTAKANGLAKRITHKASPCLVTHAKKDLLISYVSFRNGMGEVRVEPFAAKGIVASKGCPDAYDAVMAAGAKGLTWIVYTGLAKSGKYDIFVRHIDADLVLGEAVNLTNSDDDAMSPDMTIDIAGKVWVTYYRWHKMGTASRDKEIYARFFDGKTWSSELRLSPSDLPEYEDHTDPSIAPNPTGGVTVAWSWDMHRSRDPKYRRYQTEFHAESPTIFGRRVSASGVVGDLLFLGHAGIDSAPELHHAANGRLWCAWSTMYPAQGGALKALMISLSYKGAKDRGSRSLVESAARDICTPRVFGKKALWSSQNARGRWRLMSSTFANGRWSMPRVVEAKGNPRFVTVANASDGTLWMAYVHDMPGGRDVLVQPLKLK